MNFGGIQKTSLIDYSPHIVTTLFVSGCNLKCGFCHNPELVNVSKNSPVITQDEVFKLLEKRKNVLDGVCITGGEPLLYPGLADFVKKVKESGMLVKVDTNGTNPLLLAKMIDEGLVDYVAMDIKASLSKYSDVCGVEVDVTKIEQSVDILKKGKVGYEFRTTVIPKLFDENDAKDIGKWLAGAKKYVIQQFRSAKTLDKSFSSEKSYSTQELEKFKKIISEYVEKVEVRA